MKVLKATRKGKKALRSRPGIEPGTTRTKKLCQHLLLLKCEITYNDRGQCDLYFVPAELTYTEGYHFTLLAWVYAKVGAEN